MKKIASMLCIICLLFTMGCAIAYTPAGTTGFIFNESKYPGAVTSNSTAGSKVGTAQCTSILGIVAQGDASIEAAAKNGGITKVKRVDYKVFSVLGFYARLTTIVTGD